MKIIIVGPYPPPYGGISVHVKRVKRYLEDKKIDVLIYNEAKQYEDMSNNIYSIKSYKKFIFKIPFLKADVIHFHSIDLRMRILLGFYKLFRKKIILTIHGESVYNQINNSNKIIQCLLLNSLKRIDKIICVNPKIMNDLGCYGIDKCKLAYIPAYSNPIEDTNDYSKISKEVWNFINGSSFLISANGQIRFYNNEDLYGIDMLIDLVKNLKNRGKNIKLVIALLGVEGQSQEEKRYYKEIQEQIIEGYVQNDIYIYEVKDTEFYPILKKSNMFLRPTNTDGDAVSIREALYYKIPVIASDVVKRPEGTILFKTRDSNDLYDKVTDVIENYNYYEDKLSDVKLEDNSKKVLEVYEKLLSK